VILTMNKKTWGFLLAITVAATLALPACSSKHNVPSTTPEVSEATLGPTTIAEATATIALSSVWSDLLQQTPYPYTTPLPPTQATILDGIYTKLDPTQSDHDPLPEGGVSMPHPVREGIFWLKPVPYPVEGGAWILQLDRGVFRVFHETTGWRTLGSFTVSADRIEFFNDPHCYHAVGIYTWELEAGQLTLRAIEDECDGRVLGGGGLRVTNFSSQPWVLDNARMGE
jgi:hypothetical protein